MSKFKLFFEYLKNVFIILYALTSKDRVNQLAEDYIRRKLSDLDLEWFVDEVIRGDKGKLRVMGNVIEILKKDGFGKSYVPIGFIFAEDDVLMYSHGNVRGDEARWIVSQMVSIGYRPVKRKQ